MKSLLILSFISVILCSCSKNDDLPLGDIKLTVFPNPTNGPITITVESQDTYAIEITAVKSGDMIYTGTLNGITKQYDLSSFPNGFYYVKVSVADSFGRVKIEKMSNSPG